MIIVTVTLNPALDHLVQMERFEKGQIQWFSQESFAPGGKGVNVSLLLHSLGVKTKALGIAAGFTGGRSCGWWRPPVARRTLSCWRRGIPHQREAAGG